MASLVTQVVIAGNLTRDPEVRYTQAGKPVASFSVASTPRSFDKDKKEYVDGETIFTNCTLWGKPAEHFAESATKGTRVLVAGQFQSRTYQDREGNSRTGTDLVVDEVGISVMTKPIGGGVSKQTAPAGEGWNQGFPSAGDETPF